MSCQVGFGVIETFTSLPAKGFGKLTGFAQGSSRSLSFLESERINRLLGLKSSRHALKSSNACFKFAKSVL